MAQPSPKYQGWHSGQHRIHSKSVSEYVGMPPVFLYTGLLSGLLKYPVNPNTAYWKESLVWAYFVNHWYAPLTELREAVIVFT